MVAGMVELKVGMWIALLIAATAAVRDIEKVIEMVLWLAEDWVDKKVQIRVGSTV